MQGRAFCPMVAHMDLMTTLRAWEDAQGSGRDLPSCSPSLTSQGHFALSFSAHTGDAHQLHQPSGTIIF